MKPEKSFYAVDQESLDRITAAISKLKPSKEKCYRIKVTLDDESRRDKQNKLSFHLYNEWGKLSGEGNKSIRNLCKLEYGCPIMNEDTEFSTFYAKVIVPLSYETKREAMEYTAVTSLMTVKQFAEYLSTIYMEAALQGHILSQPEDLYMEALMIQEGGK